MTSLLLLLALETRAAHAAEDGDLLLVPRSAWLMLTPDRAGPRVRPLPVVEAGDHALSPTVVLHVRGPEEDGLLPVVVVPQDTPYDPQRGPATPDVAPDDWPHCYAQPATFAQASLRLWVDPGDVLPVLTRDVSVQLPGGDVLRLARGLAAVPLEDGRHRVEAMHVQAIVRLPEGALGARYAAAKPPAQRLLTGTTDAGTWIVQPTYSVLLDASGDGIRALGPASDDGEAVQRLDDRCVSITPSTPLPGVPRADPRKLRDRTTWPIGAAVGTEIVLADSRTPVGEVVRPLVLWSRRTCTWTDTEGLCCNPMAGIEAMDWGNGLCLDADLPEHDAALTPDRVAALRAERLQRITGQSSRLIPEVALDDLTVRGAIDADALREALGPTIPDLARCYDRQLSMHPELNGDVRLRFAIAPDAHARGFQVLDDTLRDEVTLRCAQRVLRLATVVPQLSLPTSVAEVTLSFRTRTEKP